MIALLIALLTGISHANAFGRCRVHPDILPYIDQVKELVENRVPEPSEIGARWQEFAYAGNTLTVQTGPGYVSFHVEITHPEGSMPPGMGWTTIGYVQVFHGNRLVGDVSLPFNRRDISFEPLTCDQSKGFLALALRAALEELEP